MAKNDSLAIKSGNEERIKELAKTLDVTNSDSINNFGSKAQMKVADFSRNLMEKIQIRDTGDMQDELTHMMKVLKENNPEDLVPSHAPDTWWRKLFNRGKDTLFNITVKTMDIKTEVDEIKKHINTSAKARAEDNQQLQVMIEENQRMCDSLNEYVKAGEIALKKLEEESIIEEQNKLQDYTPGTVEYNRQSNIVQNMQQQATRLGRRLANLKASETLLFQNMPQIRIMQEANNGLIEQTNSLNDVAIPAWEQELAISLAALKSAKDLKIQKELVGMTNDMIIRNSKLTNATAKEIVEQSNNSVIHIETLQEQQASIIDTVKTIQAMNVDASKKRKEEMKKLEDMQINLVKELTGTTRKGVEGTEHDILMKQIQDSSTNPVHVHDDKE